MRSAIIIYLVTKPDVVEAGPVFIPCRHLDSPHRAGLLPPAHCLQRTHCRHPDTERRLPSCPIFPTLHFPRLSLPPSPQKAMRRTHAHSIPGHPAGARRARSVWYRANRYRQDRRLRAANPSNASPPFHDQRRRKPTGASRERSFPHGGPRVRILLPPAASLQTIAAHIGDDFCALASGQGVKAISVNPRGALDEALCSAFATTAEPTLVEVAVD